MEKKRIDLSFPESMTFERAKEIVQLAASTVYQARLHPNGGTFIIDGNKIGLQGEDEVNFFWDVLCELDDVKTLYDSCKED